MIAYGQRPDQINQNAYDLWPRGLVVSLSIPRWVHIFSYFSSILSDL